MANVFVEENSLQDIADAIREKNGTEVTYKPSEMGDAIRGIVDVGIGSRQWWKDFYLSKEDASYLFAKSKITEPPNDLKLSNSTIFKAFAMQAANIKKIPDYDFSKGTNFQYFAQMCVNLEIVEYIDISSATNSDMLLQMFVNCYNLQHITFAKSCIKLNISFNKSPLLSDTSIQSIIDGLADLTGSDTQTLTFHTDVKNELSEEQRAIITSKNWTLA